MRDMGARVESVERRTEQNSSGLCNLHEMLHVFANLLISAVDSEVERKLEERLGGRASPGTDSSRSRE